MTGNESILHRLAAQGHAPRRVQLNGSERDAAATERYAILGEIARGGTGVVHRGRDNDLGRDVALKVLREDHLAPEFIARFVEEAQIGGQLQHPGIVPVYELGVRPDHRPYFAMKLVKGETLAARLAARQDLADGRRGLLAVYRDICRTMAYAHARGVIHRDLKPSNAMIGHFGEVQVVDWGFAKVLRRGGVADERLAGKQDRDTTMISTVRTGDGSNPSVAGSVMGTPGYMPPEQAMGRVDDLDEKSDLFSLGAILCEILTGKPPYTGSERDQLSDAAQARLGPACERLEACAADDRLVAVCKRCLSPLPKDRPASAQVLADEVAAYLRDAESRAHRAQLRALEAREHAAAQSRSRRLTTLGGLATAAALLVAGGTWLWIDSGRTQREREREAKIQTALQDAERLRSAARWSDALAAADRARALGDDGQLAAAIRAEADAAAAQHQREAEDAALLAELEDIRARRGDEFDDAQADAAFTAAILARWRDFAVDTERLRGSRSAPALAAVFDAWSLMRRQKLAGSDWQQVDRFARAIDPGHNDVRDAMLGEDSTRLAELAASEDVLELPPALLATIGSALRLGGRRDEEVALLQRARRHHPDDSWLHYQLGVAAELRKDRRKAVEHFTAALALRPSSIELRHRLGIALEGARDREGAIAVWRAGLALRPDWAHGHYHVARALRDLGRPDAAEIAYQQAIAGDPGDANALSEYAALVSRSGGRDAEALELNRRAAAINPDDPAVRLRLGIALAAVHDDRGAIEQHRACLSRSPAPDLAAMANAELAKILWRVGEHDAAVTAWREAEQDAGEVASVWAAIGNFHETRKDLDSALAAYDRALAADANLGWVHAHRGFVLLQRRRGDDLAASLSAYERAVGLGEDSFLMNHRFGVLLDELGRHDVAMRRFRRAHEIDPRRWEPCLRMAVVLLGKGDPAAALAWLDQAIARTRDDADALVEMGGALSWAGQLQRALQVYDRAVGLDPELVLAHVGRASVLHALRQPAAALDAVATALRLAPESCEALRVQGIVWVETGQPARAVEPFRKALALQPDSVDLRVNLGAALANSGDLEGARREFLAVLGRAQDHARAHYNLAWVQMRLGDERTALATYRRALDLAPTMAQGYPELAMLARLAERLPAVLTGDDDPADVQETVAFAHLALVVHADPAGALRLYRRAFEREPTVRETVHGYNAACAASRAGAANRAQALQWLRIQLTVLETLVAEDPRQVARLLAHWRVDPDLTAIRDAADLDEGCRRLWADVEALRRRAEVANK